MRTRLGVILLLLLVIGIAFVYPSLTLDANNEDYFVFYQVRERSGLGTSFYRVLSTSQLPELVATQLESFIVFSNDGKLGAYYDASGIWLSELNNWQPELIASETRSNLISLTWMPDDTRLIISVRDNMTNEKFDNYAYNLISKTLEDWTWTSCIQIGKSLVDESISIICSSQYRPTLDEFVPDVSVFWGGAVVDFDASETDIIVQDLRFNSNTDWLKNETFGEMFAYIRGYPENSLNILFADKSSITVNIDNIASIGSEGIEISPSGRYIAFMEDCTFNGIQYCLNILDVETKETLFSPSDTVTVGRVGDIAWSPDEQSVVVLGADNASSLVSLYILNRNNGEISSFPIEASSPTSIAVVRAS